MNARPRRRMVGVCRALALGAAAGLWWSAAAWAEPDARARLAQERRDVEARYHARDRECRERFAVTACVEAARRERQAATSELDARQIELDDAARRQRAEFRLRNIERKKQRAREAAAAASEAPPATEPVR